MHTNNITVVKVWGTHYERGYAYGYLCKSKIMSVWNNFVMPNYGNYLAFARAIVGNTSYFSVNEKYVTEAKGIIHGLAMAGADTTGISYLDVFVVNFMTDLQGFLPSKKMSQNCSSLMDWGMATLGTNLNGKSVISHFLDADQNDTAITNNQVIVVHLPSETDEQPWLLTGTAGQIVAAQAVNNSGLCAFLNTVTGFTAEVNKGYEPVTLAMRDAIESKDYNNDGFENVNDIRDAIAANTNGYASGFIVSSLAPSTAGHDSLIAMVAELAPQRPFVTFRWNNFKDTIEGDNLYAANGMIKRRGAFDYCSRYMNVSNCVRNIYHGLYIGSQDNWNIMRTRSTQTINLQFIQCIPENRMFMMSVRDKIHPAFKMTPVVYDLDELFEINSLGIIDMVAVPLISIFPNPVNNELTIEYSNSNAIRKFDILDIKGQLIYTSFIDKKTIIDMSAFAEGVYLLKLTTDKSIIIKKIVKQ
jgi:hypothetical protein